MEHISHQQKNQNNRIKIITFSLLLASVALIVFGITRGESRTVLQKAVLICLECIGIG